MKAGRGLLTLVATLAAGALGAPLAHAVKTTRTGKGGAYSTRYRFNSAGGRFTFRMRLRPNDSYPYARGTSKPMRVRVG